MSLCVGLSSGGFLDLYEVLGVAASLQILSQHIELAARLYGRVTVRRVCVRVDSVDGCFSRGVRGWVGYNPGVRGRGEVGWGSMGGWGYLIVLGEWIHPLWYRHLPSAAVFPRQSHRTVSPNTSASASACCWVERCVVGYWGEVIDGPQTVPHGARVHHLIEGGGGEESG